MSLSTLSRKTRTLFPYLNTAFHSPPLSRSYAETFARRYYTSGAIRCRQVLEVHSRYLMSRVELSRLSVNQHPGFLPSSRQVIPRSHTLLTSGRHYSTQAMTEQKSRKMLLYLTGLVFAMVGLSYAAVPLYRRFCQATGYGGTVQRRESVEEKIARHAKDGTVTSREVVVQFNADVADGMQWKFVPTQREVRVKPGESALAFYTAENKSSTPITGVSTYNVTPMKVNVHNLISLVQFSNNWTG